MVRPPSSAYTPGITWNREHHIGNKGAGTSGSPSVIKTQALFMYSDLFAATTTSRAQTVSQSLVPCISMETNEALIEMPSKKEN